MLVFEDVDIDKVRRLTPALHTSCACTTTGLPGVSALMMRSILIPSLRFL